MRTRLSLVPALVGGALALLGHPKEAVKRAEARGSCPAEMARVGNTCVDRWEVSTVDQKTGLSISPFYPPEPRLLKQVYQFWSVEAGRTGSERARQLQLPEVPAHQRSHFSARAVSAPDVLPQSYFTYYSAKRACEAAGKRLCTEDEWTRACRGSKGSKHPYGDTYRPGRCNVARAIHPAYELHGNSSLGHLDPRLHLVVEEGKTPLLLATGEKSSCVSSTREEVAIYDMVGNLAEWIDDPKGTFVGGFFSRQTREGCERKVENHAPAYTDYSLGARCCRSL